jgi:eukaryotic-like serine/threonine-protein kinase
MLTRRSSMRPRRRPDGSRPAGEVVGGRYELEELVGSGGMSSVYRAHDTLLERKVALKILHERYGDDDEYVERFRREARAVAQLAHPNIVTVIDRGEDEGRQFIVFEYIDGENLKEIVEREGPLALDEVVSLGLEIARGLAFAHERGIVHRDVKPQNVLLNGDGHAKVTDFGIARTLDVEKGVTQTGTVLGTSDYIAPEQASGQVVSRETDVYSLGVVLFELLTGTVPFKGESFVAVALQHVNEPPPSVLELRRDTPPRLASLIDSTLAKDPKDRPTMDELVGELEALRNGYTGGEPTAVIERPRPPRRRRGTPLPLVLAAVGALLLAAALTALLLTREDEPTPGAGSGPIKVTAVSSYDPNGGSEHEGDVPKATDGKLATYWTTESYRYPSGGFGKPGVGIVLRTVKPPQELVVSSNTPGFVADVRANGSVISKSRTVGQTTVFPLETEATEMIFWITNRGPYRAVHVNEVTAR